MKFKLSNGSSIDKGFYLQTKFFRGETLTTEDIRDLFNNLNTCFDKAIGLDYELTSLKRENLRLKHENDFMLRMIEKKDNET